MVQASRPIATATMTRRASAVLGPRSVGTSANRLRGCICASRGGYVASLTVVSDAATAMDIYRGWGGGPPSRAKLESVLE